MAGAFGIADPADHCRIGSLEKKEIMDAFTQPDHCRIGSLETPRNSLKATLKDHCRIGSLEKKK